MSRLGKRRPQPAWKPALRFIYKNLHGTIEYNSGAMSNADILKPENRILFFSLEHWDDVWRRNQFIAEGLLRRNPLTEILWIGPSTDLWTAKGRASADKKLGKTFKPDPTLLRLTSVKPYKPLPNIIGKHLNQLCLRHQVLGALKQLGWTEYIAWVNNQAARNILPLPGALGTIYDITDDWTKVSLPPRILDRVKADDQWLLDNADRVIVCSKTLQATKLGKCNSLHLIHNGVNVDLYSPDSVNRTTVPKDMDFGGLPVACYLGTLHEDRLDLDLIEHVLKGLPRVQFVFVGPNALSELSSSRLTQYSNCKLLGSRPYSQLPSYIKGCNIFINPHLVSQFTESLDPLKLYEYMATGKPIVSTACAGFREMENMVAVASNANEFMTKVEQSIEADSISIERIEWAKQHTWEQRLDQIEQILCGMRT